MAIDVTNLPVDSTVQSTDLSITPCQNSVPQRPPKRVEKDLDRRPDGDCILLRGAETIDVGPWRVNGCRSTDQCGSESGVRREPAPHFLRHSPNSDPERYSDLVADVPSDLASVCAVARNLIAHYWFASVPLPSVSNDDINARWLSRILEIDQERHVEKPLQHERAEAHRVQGCCRDQVLLAVGILRQHGIPARTRLGFAEYFSGDRRQDHVVAETWLGGRWVQFDPKLPGPREKVADPHDISTAVDSPFLTAAGAWIGYRQHGRSIDDLGIRIPTAEFMGPPFVLTYLIMDVAHRFGDELLLWDYWAAIPLPGRTMHVELGDELADLVVHADAGDVDAERQLEHIHTPIHA